MKATYIDHMGTDLSVVNAARVSFGKKSDWEYIDTDDYGDPVGSHDMAETNYGGRHDGETFFSRLSDNDRKLIKYLSSHGHKSPFNHTFLTFHVKAPIFVARQLVKHKFMPWNEVSRRYVDSEPEFFAPGVWRKRAENVKQGSSDEAVGYDVCNSEWLHAVLASEKAYNQLLKAGVCPEQARMVLPLNTYTEWYWSGTLGAFADMYNLRTGEGVQQEAKDIAVQIGEQIKPLFPVSWEALTQGDSK